MPLVAREIPVAPEPFALARRVAHRPGAALLWTARGAEPSFVACDPVERAEALDPEPSLDVERRPFGSVPRWIGLLPYEAMRRLERPEHRRRTARPEPHVTRPWWWRYRAVAVVSDRVSVVGEDRASVDHLADLLSSPVPTDAAPATLGPTEADEPSSLHEQRIRRALEHIAAGNVYQVNLARRFVLRAEGHPIDLAGTLVRRSPSAFAAAFDAGGLGVVSTSPELFLRLGPDRRVVTAPIKGTRPRGADAVADAALARELDLDPKERAELAMILDVERNDLGRVAIPGSVRLVRGPLVEPSGAVHHRKAVLSARLPPHVDREALLEAMLPSGSVTGAPKVRAMEIIAELEPHRRGLYTGALGYVSHDGGLVLAMAIRVLTVAGAEGHYFAGGGIVADSDPQREVDETGWKAVQLGGGATGPVEERARPQKLASARAGR